jgi:predicted transposase/invertase (TIGR01784 family)
MKQVISLQYGVMFKKAFGQVDIFKAFVKDIIGIELDIEKVETEKRYLQQIGNVKVEFDCYAEDLKNRVIVEIQHQNNADHYDRFLHYHCVALLEQAQNYKNYRPDLTVYTIVVLTSGDKHKTDVAIIDFDPKDRNGNPLNEIKHKVIYLAVKYVNETTPQQYKDWLQLINDSLNEKIEESHYLRPELQKTIGLIEKNLVTPEERYYLIEEYNTKERENKLIKNAQQSAMYAVIMNMLEKGLDTKTISELTNLTLMEIDNLIHHFDAEKFADNT